MKVLVAGAAGQVGCRVARQLLAHNHEVRATVLPDDPAIDRLVGLDIEQAEGDLTDEAFVAQALVNVEAVIHTANFVGPQFENNFQDRYDHCITRAKSLINYQPQGDLATMVKSALLVHKEGYQDYTWEGL